MSVVVNVRMNSFYDAKRNVLWSWIELDVSPEKVSEKNGNNQCTYKGPKFQLLTEGYKVIDWNADGRKWINQFCQQCGITVLDELIGKPAERACKLLV